MSFASSLDLPCLHCVPYLHSKLEQHLNKMYHFRPEIKQIQICRPSVGTGATGAFAPFNLEEWVPGTRPETECTYHKFSNEGYNCL